MNQHNSNNVLIVPNIEPDHMDSDHAKEMASAGDKQYGACYECDTFYGATMMTDDHVCYWCAYGDDWETEEYASGTKRYKMTVTDIVTRHYFIEAESEEDARNWRGEVTETKEVWCETESIEDIEEVN